ncbi:Hypothetical protein KNT65_gp119 [Escherichia phage EcS1]|uniref:Uncharacterized protein n=1 Tax=Escherichia phage EcS1 TaxID=2083276 RepID=A0A2Z5ZCG3_9CAUD|nr:Hypothetical protein KNT65_gp119 [Escherichia phage EcS1]BBC78167.1 Hypothetical protein [Escherichia phage EcS1]
MIIYSIAMLILSLIALGTSDYAAMGFLAMIMIVVEIVRNS